MTLEQIIQMTRKQGEDEIRKLQKATGKEVLAIVDAVTKEVEAMMQSARKEAEQEAERLGAGQVSAANLEARKLVLTGKADILQSARDSAMERLGALSIIERERIIRKLLAKARNLIPEGTVHVRVEDIDILKDNLGTYRIGPPTNITGGIIVDSHDRKRRLDLSFETLFEETWDRNYSDITHILFREGGK